MGLVTFLLHQTQYTKFVVKPNTAYLVGFAKYSDRLRFWLFSFFIKFLPNVLIPPHLLFHYLFAAFPHSARLRGLTDGLTNFILKWI